MLTKVINTIKQQKLFELEARIVVAVSGGVDSSVLLHIMLMLKKDYQLELLVAHLNHGFRGQEAREDALFVKNLADNYGLPSVIEEISVPEYIEESGQSPQEAARTVRYAFLERVRAEFGGTAIAVGQNANDQAETVLINLLRGGASSGLKGIPIKREYIIRPLLEVKRAEIEAYAAENQLNFKFDSSNAKTIYLRNKVRMELVPLLEEEFNPMIVTNLGRTAAILAEEDKLLTKLAVNALKRCLLTKNTQGLVVDLLKLEQEELAVMRRVVRQICNEVKNSKFSLNIGFDHVEQVLKLISGQTGTKIQLPGKIIFMKQYHKLYAGEKEHMEAWEHAVKITTKPQKVIIPGRTEISQIKLELDAKISSRLAKDLCPSMQAKWIICLDWDRLNEKKLFVRGREPGDQFKPAGMKGSTKKLKNFFIDEKVPRAERDKVPLLVTEDGKIVWVIGYRAATGYLADNNSKQILIITASQGK